MNTQNMVYTESQLTEVKFSGQAEIYNGFAALLDIKQIKKFRDKKTGVARILKIQDEYLAQLPEPVVEETPIVEETTKRQTRFDMEAKLSTVIDAGKDGTIENSIHTAIASGDGTVDDVVKFIVDFHKRPRSGLGVDEQYAVHNIKWFVKKGHLKLEEV